MKGYITVARVDFPHRVAFSRSCKAKKQVNQGQKKDIISVAYIN